MNQYIHGDKHEIERYLLSKGYDQLMDCYNDGGYYATYIGHSSFWHVSEDLVDNETISLKDFIKEQEPKQENMKFKVGDKLKNKESGILIEINKIDEKYVFSQGEGSCHNWTMEYLEENFILLKDDKEEMNYKIKVNPEQSRQIQEICFERGIGWGSVGKTVEHTDHMCLYIYPNGICWGDSGAFKEHKNTEISAEDFIDKYGGGSEECGERVRYSGCEGDSLIMDEACDVSTTSGHYHYGKGVMGGSYHTGPGWIVEEDEAVNIKRGTFNSGDSRPPKKYFSR